MYIKVTKVMTGNWMIPVRVVPAKLERDDDFQYELVRDQEMRAEMDEEPREYNEEDGGRDV